MNWFGISAGVLIATGIGLLGFRWWNQPSQVSLPAVLTSSRTITLPPDVKLLHVELSGGGGGGNSDGPGQAGAVAKWDLDISKYHALTIKIGQGGAYGQPGGATSLNTVDGEMLVEAAGGSAGMGDGGGQGGYGGNGLVILDKARREGRTQ